ncbi:kininogen-1 [Spea bombifrons]|uniref:kininogen-1 n=1 Tax=Spea bombifrons TaxID=233779 RepID=UPI00234B34F1|nr:kininogen-1 [Spea bombifrons]
MEYMFSLRDVHIIKTLLNRPHNPCGELAKMRVLDILFFSSHFLIVASNQALTFEANCNDHAVFKAVDLALRSHNALLEEGNQFVLHRITEARTRPEINQVHFFVDYEIREGSCGVKSGKMWQECDFLTPDGVVGKCSAHVITNKEMNNSNVAFQHCVSPTVMVPVTDGVCTGCLHHIDPNREELLDILQSTIKKMNLGNHPFHFHVENIKEASQQVVNGWNYYISYVVRQTNCSKVDFNVTTEECKRDKNGQSGECTAAIYVSPGGEINVTSLYCISESGLCLNCPDAVEPQDPELLNLLRQVVDEYNVDSNHQFLYKFALVQRATKKVHSGKIYSVIFNISETNCSKTEFSILGDECDINKLPRPLQCSVTINATDETIIDYSGLHCDSLMPYFENIQGLTPFRMTPGILIRNGRSQEKAKRKVHGRKEHIQNGKKGKRNHESKHESSEESTEQIKHQGQEMEHEMDTTTSKGPLSYVDYTTISNLPVPEATSAQRCPGNEWQPRKSAFGQPLLQLLSKSIPGLSPLRTPLNFGV